MINSSVIVTAYIDTLLNYTNG